MIRIRPGARKYVGDGGEETHPFLKRHLTGWDPTMTDNEVYDAARGWWVLAEHAERQQKYAVVVGGDTIRMVIAIDKWEINDAGKRAFAGRILPPGHEVHDRFVGQPDPVPSSTRNPIAYFSDPMDLGECLCGCGEKTRNEWAPGHDQRAIHGVIKANFGGSVSQFIDWCRKQGLAGVAPS